MTTTLALPQTDDPWKLGPASAGLMRMIGFEPTGEEQAAILRCRKRFKLVVGGGQSGKSMEAGADFPIHVFEDRVKHPEGTLLYWLLAADYERNRREFGYIADNLMAMGLPVKASKRLDPGEIRVQFKKEKKPRILVETKSGKDPRTLSMFSPHGIIVCEASQIDLVVYHKALERVTASGGWLHMSGTYEYGSYGWYPGLAGAWAHGSTDEQSFVLPTPTNKYLFPGGINDPKIQKLKRETSDQFFNEKIMGIATPPQGRVFSEFRADIHIRPVVYHEDLPLYIWDDPGYGHAHAIEIAQIAPGGQVQVFDEIYQQGRITEDLIQVVVNRPWWKNPHKTLVIDPHYAQQHQGTHSMAEIWLAPPAHLATMGVKVGIMEGIERLKSFLKVNPLTGAPGIVFDPGCKGVLSELGAYPSPFSPEDQPRWEVFVWKTDGEGNIMGNDPQDRYNDGVKACFDNRTEILTENGWRLFPDLPKGERVATRVQDGALEYQLPTQYFDEHYKGLMASHVGHNINFLLTPNHNLFVANQYSVHAYKGYRATAVTAPQFSLKTPLQLPATSWLERTARWKGEDRDWIIHQRRHGPVTVSMEAMARFYGLWLAEGSKSKPSHHNKYCIYIDQKNRVEEVRNVVAGLGLPFYVQVAKAGVTRFTISCKELYGMFAEQGRAWQKRVPRVFLNATPKSLEALLEGYFLGDGSTDKDTGHQYAASTSRGLLDDMQEAAFKAGIASNLYDYSYLRTDPRHHGLFHLSLISADAATNYSVRDRGLTTLKRDDVSYIPYDGRVYCVTVPNGVIATRRNGKIMWVGNCIYGLVEHFGLVDSGNNSFFPMKRHGIVRSDSDDSGSVLDGLRGIRPRA